MFFIKVYFLFLFVLKKKIMEFIYFLYFDNSNVSEENSEIQIQNVNGKKNEPLFSYKEFQIFDPYNNREEIKKVSKKMKGIYVFEILKYKYVYVGSSINLYSRVCSYFMPSILANADRRILRYFRKYGFKNVKLILYILCKESTREQIVEAEQYFIDFYKSSSFLLNVDLVAGGSLGYHNPMSEEMREKLRIMRGISFLMYDIETHSLIFKFQSKQYAYDHIHINHTTLNDCLYNNKLYLNRFLFSIEPINEFPFEILVSLEDLKKLVENIQIKDKSFHKKRKKIYAENIKHPKFSIIFDSINSFAKAVKGDRSTIRKYLNKQNKNDTFYRKEWKLRKIDS